MKDGFAWVLRFIIVPVIGLAIVIAIIGLWVGGKVNFTEQSILIFALMGVALFLFPYLAEFSLPGGIAFKLRGELEEVQEIQLTGEVVFNKDEKVQHLFWIDSDGKKHLLPNKDTALLFTTQKGFIGISKDRFSKIESGHDIQPLSKESFKRTKENNMFAVHDGKIFYLSSLSLPFKYGWKGQLDKMELITDEDFEKEIYH